MNAGFQQKGFKTWSADFNNYVLLEQGTFVDTNGDLYILPVGATSDLCSIPQAVTSLIPKSTAAKEGYLHDCAYRDTLMKIDGSYWSLTETESNQLFDRALKLNQAINHLIDWDLYHAVEWFGGSSFSSDRAKGRSAFLVDVSTLL